MILNIPIVLQEIAFAVWLLDKFTTAEPLE